MKNTFSYQNTNLKAEREFSSSFCAVCKVMGSVPQVITSTFIQIVSKSEDNNFFVVQCTIAKFIKNENI